MDNCINNLFYLLKKENVKDNEKQRSQKLFYDIVLKWNKIEDIDFSLINEEILMDLLDSAEEFTEDLLGDTTSYKGFYTGLLNATRTISSKKRRLL